MKKGAGIAIALAALLLLAAGYEELYVRPAGKIEQAEALTQSGDFAGAEALYAEMSEKTLFGTLRLASLPVGRYREAPKRMQENRYREAEDLMEREKYDRASRRFAELGDYRDAADRVAEPYYAQGEKLRAQGDFAGAALAYQKAGDYADAAAACSYCQGRSELEAGRYMEAETLLSQAKGFADAEELIRQNARLAASERETQARKAPYREPGHILELGSYEQDGDEANGAEPIRWKTIASEGDKVMLLAESVLDCQPYSDYAVTSWEESALRAWLNGHFLAVAFTDEEKAALTSEPIDPARVSRFDEGNPPEGDLVTLLEQGEFGERVAGAGETAAFGTAYAAAKGLKQTDGGARWWLRTDGYEGDDAAVAGGGAKQSGVRADEKGIGVRPVIWVDLNALGV
ncbi:MAG: DUF6273 domain-containing protein [Clostridia bacterium]|nr:DUF6273 domain-containing protein [Clostridia bacterium]